MGWSLQGRAMVSPPLTEALNIPMEGFDEGYILEDSRFVESDVEPFVNFGGFTLAEPEALARSTGHPEANYEFLRPQERFWRQLLTIRPETCVGWGDNTVVVSRRYDFMRALHTA